MLHKLSIKQKMIYWNVLVVIVFSTALIYLGNNSIDMLMLENKAMVINEIVSKTELLSLNASIESARVGEHGKGFAVILFSEILEISKELKNIMAKTEDIVFGEKIVT
jgi:hypothetical protein